MIATTGDHYARTGAVCCSAILIIALSLLWGCGGGSGSSSSSGGGESNTTISVSVAPTTVSVQAGQPENFTATVTNDSQNKGVTWALSGAGCSGATCGTLSAASSASGAAITYSGPSAVPSPATVTITATSVTDTTKSASGMITVTAGTPVTGLSVSITPTRGGLAAAQALQFTATVTNDVGAAGVTWLASGGGTFSVQSITSATLVAPTTPGTVTVTATSIADVTKSASATIGVTNLAGVTTYHNDLSRDGVNAQEYALTTANVSASFGKLFSCAVDGAVYAQPLWVAGLTVGGAKHNVIVVATQHDSLYAFDADASPCSTLWHANLIDSTHGGTGGETSVPSGPTGNLVGGGSGDITPEVGVTGTPVIDPSTNTLYVVSKSVIASGPAFFQRLHAIDLTTGKEKFSGPTAITATFPGTGDGGTTDTFNPGTQNQRPGLALVNGVVYVGWASHEDQPNYYGWLIGYSASTLAQVNVLNVTPNVGYGGIWMSGAAPAADASNNLYVITANGGYDASNGSAPNNDYGDSFLKLGSGLSVTDWFTPSDQATDDANDQDFGAGGAAILVDQPSGPAPHLVMGGGKDGNLYLLSRDNMGHLGDSDAWQEISFGVSIFSTGAFWNNSFYLAGVGGPLTAYPFNTTTDLLGGASSVSPTSYGFPGASPSVSSNGASNGIVWTLDNSQYCTPQSSGCGPAILHAYDATNLGNELWNSSQGSGNTAGNAVKFAVPTVANGKVYVGTRGSDNSSGGVGELDVYGLLPN